jgi:hypothetical protein
VAIPHPTVFARSAATRQSSTQLSLRGAQRRGNLSVSLGLLHSVRNDGEKERARRRVHTPNPHPTVFARSSATWQSFTQLSLRGAQRRGNPPHNCLCEERSDAAIYRYRLDCFTPFAMTGKRSVREDECIPRTPTQLSLRGAQRRGNLSVSLGLLHSVRNDGEKERARRRVHTPNPHPSVFARSAATWQSIGIACGDDKPVAMWFFYQGASTE